MSLYKHPLEMTTNSIVGRLVVYTFLGLNTEAGAIYTLLGEFFYHTNVRTPQWIGYVFQHPEIHRIHHEYEKQMNNYVDIVWWDILFDTYENPQEFKSICGYDTEKELRLKTCLRFKDVHRE